MKIGIISDTHGLLRPEVVKALMGCDAILHGGDINRQEILDQLNTLAPVYVVRGNNDKEWAEHLPLSLDFTLTDLRIFMTLHKLIFAYHANIGHTTGHTLGDIVIAKIKHFEWEIRGLHQ